MDQEKHDNHKQSLTKVIEVGTRLAVILFIVGWCFMILSPFLNILVWCVIISVAVFPFYDKVKKKLKGRASLAATTVVLIFFIVLLVPVYFLTDSLIQGIVHLRDIYQSGDLVIPAPGDRVKDWPAFAKPVVDFWKLASENLQAAIGQYRSEVNKLVGWIMSVAAGTGLGIAQMLLSIIGAGVLLRYSDEGAAVTRRIFARLAGDSSERFFELVTSTIRSVVKGILGVAGIQALMAGIGFVVIGIPAAGLWTLFCLILAMMQVGVGPIVIPMVIYVFSTYETGPAVLFMIWAIITLVSDNILKPFLLGRGSSVPMLVVFLGSIGGFIASGLTGLFLGPVILSMGYVLFQTWLSDLQVKQDSTEQSVK